MITSAAEYEHVTGDLDKIRIDGGILPLRGDDGVLRGEDICFLMEAARERLSLSGGKYNQIRFSKTISARQVNDVTRAVSNASFRYSYEKWINEDRLIEQESGDATRFIDMDNLFDVPEFNPEHELTRGDRVSNDRLVKMYNHLRLLNVKTSWGFENPIVNWQTHETGSGGMSPLSLGDYYIYRFDTYTGDVLDTTQTASPATITLSKDDPGNHDFAHCAKKVEIWNIVSAHAQRTIRGKTVFHKTKRLLLKVGESEVDPEYESVTIDATYLSERASSILERYLGFTPQRPSEGSELAYLATSSSHIGNFSVVNYLRDKTKWY